MKKLLALWTILLMSVGASFAAGAGTTNRTTQHKSATGSHAQVKKSSHVRSASSRSSAKSVSGKKGRRTKKSARSRGQQAIDGGRIREIQGALIRANYLKGEPSGVWDQDTKSALMRFQSDNGWQSKVVPDSRALIKLGLGPSHQNVINPESSGVIPAETMIPAAAARANGGDSPRLQPGGSAN